MVKANARVQRYKNLLREPANQAHIVHRIYIPKSLKAIFLEQKNWNIFHKNIFFFTFERTINVYIYTDNVNLGNSFKHFHEIKV